MEGIILGENFVENINWGLVIGVLGVLATLLGVYVTKKSSEKENAEAISNVNLTDDTQVGNLKVDNSRSNFYGETKIIKDNIFELNNEQSKQVTKDILTIRLRSYFKQLDSFEKGNLALSQLKPIEYSENEIVRALIGIEDTLVMDIIDFINDTQRLPSLFEERKNFYIEKGFKENNIVFHAHLNTIDKNIERTLISIRDKKKRIIFKKIVANS